MGLIDGTIESIVNLSDAHKIPFKFAVRDYINNGSIHPLFNTIQNVVTYRGHTVVER